MCLSSLLLQFFCTSIVVSGFGVSSLQQQPQNLYIQTKKEERESNSTSVRKQ
jgi:hypothetical protein